MRRVSAFTLVEMIIVMALLAIVMAIAAPSLSRSMKERNLPDEAARFLAATEYARSEAESQGVPMVVWVDPSNHRLGIEAKAGFDGEPSRIKEFTWNEDISFETDQKVASGQTIDLVEFGPDGAPTELSVDSVKLVDRFGAALTIARTVDRWSYEILRDVK